jgi:hypothetical protein
MMEQLTGDLQAETDMINSVARDEAHIRSKIGQVINTLTMIMWGAKNPYFSAAEGEALHAAMPGSVTVIFKTSGLYPQLEHPNDFGESLIFEHSNAISSDAPSAEIRDALHEVLTNESYRNAARRMAAAITDLGRGERAVMELEALLG